MKPQKRSIIAIENKGDKMLSIVLFVSGLIAIVVGLFGIAKTDLIFPSLAKFDPMIFFMLVGVGLILWFIGSMMLALGL